MPPPLIAQPIAMAMVAIGHLVSLSEMFATPSNTPQEYKNICLNNKDKDSLSNKDILEEFRKGPCSPIMLQPGIDSSITKLRISISDCEQFKEANAKLFYYECDWTHCSKSFYEFWKRVPEKEYQLHLPRLTSWPNKASGCFSALIQPNLNFNATRAEDMLIPTEGFKVTIDGNTTESLADPDSDCGNRAGFNSFQTPHPDNTNEFKGFSTLISQLKIMGYVSGITLQTLPWDFRHGIKNNNANSSFIPILEGLYKLSGKRVVILGHNMGNNNILYNLSKIPAKRKKLMVKAWINTAGPLLGATESIVKQFGGDSAMLTEKYHGLGSQMSSYKKAFSFDMGLYEMLPHNTFETFKDADWMKDLKTRMDYEKKPDSYKDKDKGVNWFPDMTQHCSYEFEDGRPTNCTLSILDMSEIGVLKVKHKKYYARDIPEALKNYGMAEEKGSWINFLSANEAIDNLVNPEIPVVLIYIKGITTNHQVTYDHNPKTRYTDMGYIANPDEGLNGTGDGTVLTGSSLTPLIKWAYEFNNKLNENASAVKIVEFCGSFEPMADPYDSFDGNGEGKVINEVNYFGLDCACNYDEKSDGSACNHGSMLSDRFYVDFVSNSLISQEVSLYNPYRNDDVEGQDLLESLDGREYYDLDEDTVRRFTEQCCLIANDFEFYVN